MGGSTNTGGRTQTTQQQSGPWSGQEPYLRTGFRQAEQNVLERPLEYFPGSTVVPYSQQSEEALGAQEARARDGSPLLRGAQGYTQNVLGGQYLMEDQTASDTGDAVFDLDRFESATATTIQISISGNF